MLETVYWIMYMLAVGYAAVLMNRVRNTVQHGQKDKSELTKKERIYIACLVLLAPVVAGAIFYYGWMKRLPKKSKQANYYNLLGFGILLLLFFAFGGRIS